MGIIRFNEQIFVCGGWNGETLNSVEKYSIETDSWKTLSPMNISRDEFAIVALGKYLYAIGGREKDSHDKVSMTFYYFYFILLASKTYLKLKQLTVE